MLLVPVSIGELVDKITILEIKLEKITNNEALANIEKELKALKNIQVTHIEPELFENLKHVNIEIWNVEDELREYEHNQIFNNEFVTKARSVYILNDKRAAIKKHINNKYNSEITEEKSYSVY
jgi:hypothetical protein